MRYIAHRGLFDGPDPERENHPDQIMAAFKAGFEVEIDLRVVDGAYWLGHDEPQYEISPDILLAALPKLWIHAKNIEALERLAGGPLNYFWHDTDAYTLTAHNNIWTYPGKALTPKSVWVQPEWAADWKTVVGAADCLGICSKHVQEIKTIREPPKRRR